MKGLEEAFLDRIKEEPKDAFARACYADFLDENDRPEEADFLRTWTPELHDQAVTFFTNLAEEMTREDGDEAGDYMTDKTDVDDLVACGWKHVEYGLSSCPVGSGFWADEWICDEKNRKQFWYYWSMITGKPFTPDSPGLLRDGYLFSCCR